MLKEKTSGQMTSTILPKDLKKIIKKHAKANHRSLSGEIASVLEEYYTMIEKDNKKEG